jgi:hypothetical protein
MSNATDIKNAIQGHLAALKTAGTIGGYLVQDFRENLLDQDFPAYPCAVLLPPAIDSEPSTNDSNLRTYSFDIVFVVKKDDIGSGTYIEDLIEAVLDEFDSDVTLGGAADGGSPPGSSVPDEVTAASQTYVVFVVTLKPRAIKNISL